MRHETPEKMRRPFTETHGHLFDVTDTAPAPAELAGPAHPRAVEMAKKMAEETGAYGSATEQGLLAAGFTCAEIVHHKPAALAILRAGFEREVRPGGDRVPDFLDKAVMAAVHVMPCCAGIERTDAMATLWAAFCRTRAAWKTDPWVSQSERCLSKLKAFLSTQPLLEPEKNRIVFGLAASQKADRTREVTHG